MKIAFDTIAKTLSCENDGEVRIIPLYSEEAFELISQVWLKVGWDQKYAYKFSWLGRPIIQLPEDMVRIQEVIYRVKPDVIIETGIAHGGSLIYYASVCRAMGRGRVIGIDIEIRPHNRQAIEQHELAGLISLVEGDSAGKQTLMKVKSLVNTGETVLVILDSNHSRQHVLNELEAYHVLITPGSYIVATDGIMKDLYDVPGGNPDWQLDNPVAAAAGFVQSHPEFVLEQPARAFNESALSTNLTYWPDSFLRRVGE